MPHHELDPVEVDWFPVVAVSAEGQTLLTGRRVDKERAASAYHLNDPVPGSIADPGRYATDEDTWGHLKEPSREVSAQSCRARGQDDNDHGITSRGRRSWWRRRPSERRRWWRRRPSERRRPTGR